jgi:MATE family multidrug resistance protein
VRVYATNNHILKLAAPISLALLIPQVNFLTNTIFLGQLPDVSVLGVNGICGIFYLALSMVGYGLCAGIQVQMSRRAGEGDHPGLAYTFKNGILLGMLFALGIMMLSLWLAPIIFGLSLYNSDNIYQSIGFLYIRVWGLPFLMLTQLCNSFFISIHRSRYMIYGSVAGTAVNILLDYLLIFGKGGFPAMGLDGAAIASVISELAACVVMFGTFWFNKFHKQYPLKDFLSFDTVLAKRSLTLASPLIVQYLFGIGGWLVFFIFVEHLGKMELAASQILRSIFGIVGIGTWALASTCNTMVSNIIGQRKQREVIYLVSKVARISIIYTAVVSGTLFLFPEEFLLLYRNDPALAAFAAPSLRVIAVATLIMSLATVVFNGVVGTGNTLINLTIEISCIFCYLIYCYIVVQRMHCSLEWAWASEFVYWNTLLSISFLYLKSGRWKGKVV